VSLSNGSFIPAVFQVGATMNTNDSSNRDSDDFEDLNIEPQEEPPAAPVRTKHPVGSRVKVTMFFRSTIGPGEKLEKLTVDSEMPVAELKQTIGAIFSLAPEDFHLSFAGRVADPDDILSNYDIEDGSEALIIPVSTAGVIKSKYNQYISKNKNKTKLKSK
jgi:hypothetical protein